MVSFKPLVPVIALTFMVAYSPHVAAADAAAGDVEAGKSIALEGAQPGHPRCASCHMDDGSGQVAGGIPRLAGLPASYIEKQLSYFADGKRENAFMPRFAAALTPEMRRNVAAYYASLPAPAYEADPSADTALIASGEALYKKGKPKDHVMACMGCHGPTGAGVGTMFPAIAGQPADYVSEQLTEWHSGAKRDPDSAIMMSVAKGLTAEDIRALAAYVRSLGVSGKKS